MIRTLLCVAIYVLLLGILSFRVDFRDGLRIKLTGWPEALWRIKSSRTAD